jgi:hypothetical protein
MLVTMLLSHVGNGATEASWSRCDVDAGDNAIESC